METAKKGGKAPVNGTRKVSAHLVNGNLISQDAQTKWSRQRVWDVSWYNFQTNKWEPEAQKPLTYRQAYARALYLTRTNPYNKIGVVLVPGYSKIKPKESVDA